MTNKKVTLALVVVAIIAIGAFFFPRSTTVVERIVGAASEQSESVAFNGGLTFGSNCFATTTSGILSSRDLLDNGCVRIAAGGAGQEVLSLTLPASTTIAFLPKAGQCREWFVDAGSVAAATTTTFLLGTGLNLVGLDATGAGTGADVFDGNEFGVLKMCRQANKDVLVFLQEYLHAD